jgi:MacB-like protein
MTILSALRQDVGYALRGFRRAPGFTVVALLILAVGIAANTTIFSVVNAVLLRPLPVAEPAHLRFLSVTYPGLSSLNSRSGVPYRTYEQLAQRTDVFDGVAGFSSDGAKLGNGANANAIVGERVTPSYFDVLRVHAALGRTLVPADNLPGAEPVIVVSDRFWRTKLDANPNVLGTTLDLRAPQSYGGTYLRYHRIYTIVGVMPPHFKGISTVWVPSDYWVPLRQRASDMVAAQAEISGGTGDIAAAMEMRMRSTLVARPVPDVSEASVRAVVYEAEQAMPETPWATSRGVRNERGVIVVDQFT